MTTKNIATRNKKDASMKVCNTKCLNNNPNYLIIVITVKLRNNELGYNELPLITNINYWSFGLGYSIKA